MVGAGIFGTHISIELARRGFDVTLAEKSKTFLSGTSGNSILRVHSGLHYPRDMETAVQSQRGYKPFLLHYKDCIRVDFPNYYGLAKVGSKSSKNEIEATANSAGIEIHEIPLESLEQFGMKTASLDAAWQVEEGVVDLEKLDKFFSESISTLDINTLLNTEVRELIFSNGYWTAISDKGNLGKFEYIVRATHGQDSIISNVDSVSEQFYEFHLTSMLELGNPSTDFGMTVLDGDFISLLPAGFTNNYLVYGPGVSILSRHTGKEPPIAWSDRLKMESRKTIDETIRLLEFWFPSFNTENVIGLRNTVRAVQSNVKSTDRRVSQVIEIAPGFFDIHSTKIDHVVEVSEYILKQLASM